MGDPAPCHNWAPAPKCGEQCTSTCGCDYATSGPACSDEGVVDGNANHTCYQLVTACSQPGRCLNGPNGPACMESKADCDTVRAAYENQLAGYAAIVRSGDGPLAPGSYSDVQCAASCKVYSGHCAQGLDTCWLLPKYLASSNPELDRLADLYQTLGCPALGHCDCPPAPVAVCKYGERLGSDPAPLTCIVQ